MSMSDSSLVEVICENNIACITINRPEARNALSLPTLLRLREILSDVAIRKDIWAVTLTGAGDKAFCAGADISQFAEKRSSEDAVAIYNAVTDNSTQLLATAAKPTIAKIEGFCIGGGMGIAMCCDIRIANDQATFAVPAAKLGLGYRGDGLKRLVDVVGPSFSKEIFYTARQFTAQEALTMGLVNRIIPRSILSSYVDDYTKTIVGNAPMTVSAARVVINELMKGNNYDEELANKAVDDCFASEDYQEGRTAFMEKRIPKFKGR